MISKIITKESVVRNDLVMIPARMIHVYLHTYMYIYIYIYTHITYMRAMITSHQGKRNLFSLTLQQFQLLVHN